MKKYIMLFVCAILFLSCKQSKWGIVNDFIDATNGFGKEATMKLLADSFMYYGKDTLNKEDFLARFDSLRAIEVKSIILKSQEIDGIVKTEEKTISIIDSLLEVKPDLIQMKSYRFSNDKLESITIDSTLNYEEYTNSFKEKMGALSFYIRDQYDLEDEKEITQNINKYLTEFRALSASEKRTYRTYANLQGTYTSKNCAYYRKLIFRGKKTATIIDAFFGFRFNSDYEVDENYVKIKTDKSDLLLEIKDSRTLIGEGFAKGTFTKAN